MGVTGLSGFIKEDCEAFEKCLLRDTTVVVDANNLNQLFLRSSQGRNRADLFGGDMISFGRTVERLIGHFRACNVEPIMVFDGAQTKDEHSKTPEKYRRALQRFREVQDQASKFNCDKFGFGQVIMPILTASTLRQLFIKNRIKLIQCMFEADLEIAKIANHLNCPIISNDSDFFIFDIHAGVISVDSINLSNPIVLCNGKKYIACSKYRIDKFVSLFPNLDKRCLPILSVLAGNDYVKHFKLKLFCDQLPLRRICDLLDITTNEFNATYKYNKSKIVRLLFFLCDKSPVNAVNTICEYFAKEDRARWKDFIYRQLEIYNMNERYIDSFHTDFAKLANSSSPDKSKTSSEGTPDLRDEILAVSDWLQDCYQKSGITQRLLEIAHHNIIYIRSVMDDLDKPSANNCQYRVTQVILTLFKFYHQDYRPLVVYDRIHDKLSSITLKPMKNLPGLGTMRCCIMDIPKLPQATKQNILVATFHCSANQLKSEIQLHERFFNRKDLCMEFVIVKMLLNFIDCENPDYKLPPIFHRATLLTMLYYFCKSCSSKSLNFNISKQIDFIDKRRFNKSPEITRKSRYCRALLHDINRLSAAILSFNLLNGLLGEVIASIRPYLWLNNCMIYNLLDRSTVSNIVVHEFIDWPFAQPNPRINNAQSNREPSNKVLSNGAPSIGAPGNGAPRNGAPRKKASRKKVPSDGAPGNAAPSDGAPGNGAPSNAAPSDGAPSNGAPSNGAPGEKAPSNGAPGKKAPGKKASRKKASRKKVPSDGGQGSKAPSNGAPGKKAPGNGAPGKKAPGNGAPGNKAPGKKASRKKASRKKVPSDGGQGSKAPSDGAPGNGAPSNGAPSNGAPSNGASHKKASRKKVPSDGGPGNKAPSNAAPSNKSNSH